MHSISTKEEALKLRLAGKSYNEINKEMSISKSTLHLWLSQVELSQQAQERINQRVYSASMRGLLKRNKLQTHRAKQRAAKNNAIGKSMIASISKQELIVLGAALYWGEGYKRKIITNGKPRTHHPVSLSNSDPEIIRIFIKFLRQCFGIKDENIGIQLRIYEHMSTEATTRFWQSVTNIPRQNFSYNYNGASISSKHRRPYNRLPYGTAQVRVNSTVLFHQIMGLIEALKLNTRE